MFIKIEAIPAYIKRPHNLYSDNQAVIIPIKNGIIHHTEAAKMPKGKTIASGSTEIPVV